MPHDIFDLTDFTILDTTECGRMLRQMGDGAESMEETAGRIVKNLYDSLIYGQTHDRACSLVRFFKTHSFERLDNNRKAFVLDMLGSDSAPPAMKCLTLLATLGENPDWNSRMTSTRHLAIPLPSEQAVLEIPMLRNLIKQLGVDVSLVVKPDWKLLLDMEQKTYNVFLVQEALGSPYIPAQDGFVIPYKIKSVLGFGGIFPSGDIYVIIMFLKVPVTRETADLFKSISLNVRLAVLPFESRVFG